MVIWILIGSGVVLVLTWHALDEGIIDAVIKKARGVWRHREDTALAEAFAKHGGHRYRYAEPDWSVINGRGDAAWQRAEQAERRLRGQG